MDFFSAAAARSIEKPLALFFEVISVCACYFSIMNMFVHICIKFGLHFSSPLHLVKKYDMNIRQGKQDHKSTFSSKNFSVDFFPLEDFFTKKISANHRNSKIS